MDVKKKGLIAAVVIAILLLIGAFFIFKNNDDEPNGDDANNNQQEVKKDNEEEKENEDEKEEEEDTKKPQMNNSSGNAVTAPADTTYEDAKDAIEKATDSLTQEDIDAAIDLIEKVTNKTEKEELEEVIEDLKELKSVVDLLQELQSLVDEAEAKDDITEAGKYRDAKKIQEAITALPDSEAKALCQELLDKLSNLIDDETKPVIEGINDGELTNKEVNLKVSDLNGFTISVTRDGKPHGSNLSQTEDGTYVVAVIDDAFNKASITFTIDKTGPTFEGLEDGKYYQENIDIVIKDTDLDKINRTICNPGCVTTEIKNNSELSKERNYQLKAIDKLGNETIINVGIDKVDPEIIIDGLTSTTTKFNVDKEVKIIDSNLKSVVINGVEQQISGTEFNTKLTESNVYEIVATDLANRETKVTIEIDKNGPKFVGLTNGLYYTDNITINVEDEDLSSITKNICTPVCGTPESIATGTVLSDEVIYELIATDKLGNMTTIIVGIDKTSPVLEVDDTDSSEITINSVFAESKTIKIIEKNLKSVTINDVEQTISGADFTITLNETGNYTIVATDHANQKVSVSFAIDVTGPMFSINANNTTEPEYYTNTEAVVTIDEGTIQKEITCVDSAATTPCYENFDNNSSITEGTVKLVATDALGNRTYLTIVIDKIAPVIKVGDAAITNNQVFNTSITPIIEETKIDTMLLNATEYEGSAITEEGVYTLVVNDKAGNSTSVTFIVRLTAIQTETPTYDMSTENIVKVSIGVNKEVKVVKIDSETNEYVEDSSWQLNIDGTNFSLTKEYIDNTPSTGETITIQDITGATTDVTINVTTLGSGT